jgi:hypothetical protein
MGLKRAADWLFPAIGMIRSRHGYSIMETYMATDIDYLKRKGIKCRAISCDYASDRIRFVVPDNQADKARKLLSGRRR